MTTSDRRRKELSDALRAQASLSVTLALRQGLPPLEAIAVMESIVAEIEQRIERRTGQTRPRQQPKGGAS